MNEKLERNLTSYLRIKKVLNKTNSKIWAKFNENDIIIISLPIVNNSGYRGAKQVYANISRNRDGIIEERGKCSMSTLYSYIGPTSTLFELEELSFSVASEVKTYCNDLCLTKDPDSCETCPLNKFNKL